MTFEQLRLKHPRLTYESYAMERIGQDLVLRFRYVLDPDIAFLSVVTVPLRGREIDEQTLAPYAFTLGMVDLISYWKAACPREIVIGAGPCGEDRIRFFTDLLIHGLGEFFYRNGIDFTVPGFVTVTSPHADSPPNRSPASEDGAPDLILVGGGKDSAVTLGILKDSDRTIQTMLLNPTRAATDLCTAAGIDNPIVVTRRLDPKLFELNAQGYLNGHTPFSAYLACLGSLVGTLYGCGHVVVSNEQSANEANTVYRGMEINHQYSKSYRFESMFRSFAAGLLPGSPAYFSFLRPLNDLQVGRLFAGFPEFFTVFRSCNVGSRENRWCGSCAKCAFTYLILSPFLSREQMMASFGGDLFASPEIIAHLRAETGLEPVKPFECVGTRDESRLAVYMVIRKYVREGREVPEGLLLIKSDLAMTDVAVADLEKRLMENWADTYDLPEEYLALLRRAWEGVKP